MENLSVVSCSVLRRPDQHLCPRYNVLLLWPGCTRPSHAEIPVVETVPDISAAGERLQLCSEIFKNVRASMFESLNRSELCRLSRCNLSWSLCTQRTTCSQIATTLMPWMLWWLVTASPSSSSSVTFIIRATSGRRRSRNETPWWGNTQLKHNGLKKIQTYIYGHYTWCTLKVYFLKK